MLTVKAQLKKLCILNKSETPMKLEAHLAKTKKTFIEFFALNLSFKSAQDTFTRFTKRHPEELR